MDASPVGPCHPGYSDAEAAGLYDVLNPWGPSDDFYLPQDDMKALYQRDLAAARRLLADAGVAPGRELRTVVLDVGTTYSDTSQLLKSQLAEIGFNRFQVMMAPFCPSHHTLTSISRHFAFQPN